MTELSVMHKNSLKGNIKIKMVCKTQFYSVLPQLMDAFAINFAEGIDPSERYYDKKALRNHLLQCFRNNEINQFPQEDISVKSKPSKIVYKVYQVFCVCKDVFFGEDVEKEPENFMAECSKRGESYHRKCQVMPNKVFVKPNATWECSFCLFRNVLFRTSEI